MHQRRLPARLLAMGLACALSAFSASPARPEPGGPVSFRTMGYADKDKALHFDVNVWYPAKRGTKKRTLHYPPWEVKGATRTIRIFGKDVFTGTDTKQRILCLNSVLSNLPTRF